MGNNYQVDFFYNKIKNYKDIEDDIWKIINMYFGHVRNFKIQRKIQWILVNSLSSKNLSQGWKIHISATRFTAIEILTSVSQIILKDNVTFKVVDTIETLKVMNDAYYPRGYSGKFITIYPDSTEQFIRLVKRIHYHTKNLSGPIILSDKRYKDGIVFYRYGGFKAIYKNNDHSKFYIYDPKGNLIEDKREAWCSIPTWIDDPFKSEKDTNKIKPKINANKNIKLLYAIRHANKGGIYVGIDSKQDKLIIKEARKNVATDSEGYDASDYLKNEYSVLQKLQYVKSVPKTIDFLETNDSSYLLEEYVEGKVLSSFIPEFYKFYNKNNIYQKLINISKKIISSIISIHKNKIIIRDISKNNIIITPDYQVKIIDFEISYQQGNHLFCPFGGTEAYYYKDRDITNVSKAEDIYSLGCVLFFIFTGRDPLFFEKEATTIYLKQKNFLEVIKLANNIPSDIINLISDMLNPLQYNTLNLQTILYRLQQIDTSVKVNFNYDYKFMPDKALKDISSFLYENLVLDTNNKRIMPTSISGEKMSPLCIQSGSSGIGFFLLELLKIAPTTLNKKLLSQIVDWTLYNYKKSDYFQKDTKEYSLYFGISGVLWFLLDAAIFLNDNELSSLVQEEFYKIIKPDKNIHDIVLGNAGFGMAAIHFYMATKNDIFLKRAIKLSEFIEKESRMLNNMLVWPLENDIFYGFAHGNAGICHFFNILYAITRNLDYLEMAKKASEIIISDAFVRGGIASWNFGPNNNQKWSHWCNGSSGIGSALARLYLTTKDPIYIKYSKLAAEDVYKNMWNSSICQCHGACGNSEFLYDMYNITHNKKYLKYVKIANEYISVLQTYKNGFNLNYDETTYNISCDWGVGLAAASIALAPSSAVFA